MIDGMRRGFSLLELLIVIGVILALMAMAYPLFTRIAENSRIASTRQKVYAIAGQMSPYAHQRVSGKDGISYPYWAVGQAAGDTEIDGDPGRYPATHPLAVRAPATYTGFARMTGYPGSVNALGQPLDSWHRPLHILYAAHTYLPDGFGVWSTGPKGVGDDINSWTNGEK
jgi:prepilin-type N-terminal cleavage/methylation domain-containing protein